MYEEEDVGRVPVRLAQGESYPEHRHVYCGTPFLSSKMLKEIHWHSVFYFISFLYI